METVISEQIEPPEITNYEFRVLQLLAYGYSRARIAQVLGIAEISVKAVVSRLASQFDFYRPTRRDWMQAYRKHMYRRKMIETKDVQEVLQTAYNRSEEVTRLVIMEIAEELYITLKESEE